jgi:MinD-like ATPase involved in chromosome partitioning or flagellar assembly
MSETDARGGTSTTTGSVPRIAAEVRLDGSGYLMVDGVREEVRGTDMSDVGGQITGRIAALAGVAGQALVAQIKDPDGVWMLLVHADGRVDEAPPEAEAAAQSSARVITPLSTPVVAVPHVPPATQTAPEHTDQESLGELLAPRRRARQPYATKGFRGFVRRVTFGAVSLRPGRKERAHLSAIDRMRRQVDGPRTIVVINPKGGAHKTTATLLLAAAFGLQRGGYTLAWDNNETHGTLGWRSSAGNGGGTALDLLEALPRMSISGEVRVGDLDKFVRTQPEQQFDVLASDEDASSGAFVDARSFAALHKVLTRFYRVIVVDTGNNIRSSNWRAAVEAADQLVIVSTIREDTAQSAAWAVDALRAAGMADAVRKAVTILSAPEQKVDKDLSKRLRKHFGVLTRSVIEVPFDQALVSGGPIEYGRLRPDTQEAWLQAAAAIADGL